MILDQGRSFPNPTSGTDLIAIYQHWTSSQWVLNYLAMGLVFSLVGHNVVSALYYWRYRDTMAPRHGELND